MVATSRVLWPLGAVMVLPCIGSVSQTTGWPARRTASTRRGSRSVTASALIRAEKSHVTGIEELLDRMEREEFDLVAIGRALLGDAEWLTKILAGRTNELTPFHAGLLGQLH
jgi:2,4-dienoyl-CoA reductase-like NADH-dependent reductase (Old Yellow Enzyme family)